MFRVTKDEIDLNDWSVTGHVIVARPFPSE